MLLKFLPLALFFAIAGFLWRGLALDPGKLPSPLIDKPAPAFTVATLPGTGRDAAADGVEAAATDGAADRSASAPDGAGEGAGANGSDAAGEVAAELFDSEAMAGQVWLLNVWASWCGPCAQEHPQLVALTRLRDVPIVGLNYKDDPANARAWLDRYGDIFSDVLSDIDGAVGLDWGVYGVPETFVIDAEGRVRYKHVGPILREDLEGTLLPILDELTGTVS